MINEILRNAIYYLEAFLKRPLWAIVPVFATLGIGIGVIFALPRSYQSEAQLLIEAPQSATSLVPATIASEQMQFVEQRLLARDKLLALAEKLDLFPGLRNTMSNTKLGQLVRQQISINTVATEPSDRYAGTTAMRIGFTASNAEQASAAVSELVKMIIEENRSLRILRASEMSAFLSREVAEMTEELKAREGEWQSFVEQNADALPGRIQSLDNELQEKDRELASLDQSISTLDQELRLLEAELRLGMQRPEAVARDRTQLAELESELATKSLTYSDVHPEIRALTQRIEGIKKKVASDAAFATQTSPNLTPELVLVAERIDIAKARHQSLVANREEVNERIAWLRATTARAPSVQAQFEAIQRERETLQRNLDEMRARLSTARIGGRLERDDSTAHVQVIEQPETPRYPSSPSRTRLLLLVIGAAFAAGAGSLYLRDCLQQAIRGTFDLKASLADSTLVVIPQWSPGEMRRSFAGGVLDRIAAIFIRRPATT